MPAKARVLPPSSSPLPDPNTAPDTGRASLLPLPAQPGQPGQNPSPAPAPSGTPITTADQFKQAINTGVNTNAGQVALTLKTLNELKAQMQAGKLTVAQYQQIIEPNVGYLNQIIGGGLSSGQQGAQAAKDAGAQTILDTFLRYDPTTSKYVTALPFTGTEYAQLPNSALPTQDDVQKGLFDPKLAPISRFQTGPDAGPQAPGSPAGTPNTGGTTIPGVDQTGKTSGGIPSGGITGGNTPGGIDSQKLLDEANYANQLRQNTMAGNQTQQDAYIKQIGDLLQKQQDATFKQDSPGIYEDLNSRGLLRSSALGDRLSKEAAILSGQTSNQLGQVALGQDLQNLNQNTLNTGALIGDRQSAIGRQFSLEDYARQLDAAQRLGSNVAPTIRASGGKGAAGGALTGAATGAAAGSTFGPAGAGVGAGVGAAGGYLSSK